MDTETDWVYRVFEPHGSEGWRPYGRDPERWRGMITTDDMSEGPRYAVSLVVADLMTEWQALGLPRARHVRVFLWRDEEGDEADADIIVEVRPSIHALPTSDRARWCGGGARVPVRSEVIGVQLSCGGRVVML
ncbi:hypothetical protein N8I84_31270 [Streptomyces cynarae]|uniref:Uncharacterized protein n=1 Tax=Streptomyces cynarae TaxID=2981134 RepID=A0ABY6EFE1_9ACTN|nr:hypothetical protein [Streptomyces cynarae]UXY22693.1 hypothetical protein N8I84_31270 [Streptomyces cynarae]